MKRTVEIGPRYQPVIDFYKGYNNAEFNVLTTNLLCAYKLLKQEKNLDLLVLAECLKGYSITLPELMTLISKNCESIPQEQIKLMEQANLSQEAIDETVNGKKARKPRVKKNSTVPIQQAQPVQQVQSQNFVQNPNVQGQQYYINPNTGYAEPVFIQSPTGVPIQDFQKQQVFVVPAQQPQQIVTQQPEQKNNGAQHFVIDSSKKGERPKFNLMNLDIDLSD